MLRSLFVFVAVVVVCSVVVVAVYLSICLSSVWKLENEAVLPDFLNFLNLIASASRVQRPVDGNWDVVI